VTVNPGERWLSVGEASRALGMSRTTLLAAESAGLITPVRTPGGHRRYPISDIESYLRRHGAAAPPESEPRPPRPAPSLAAVGIAESARTALRPFVRALDGDSAGLYRFDNGLLRFCAAFGIPRWLTERMGDSTPPAEFTRTLESGRLRVFDSAAAAFPEPRSTGNVLVLPLHAGDQPLGVAFLLTRRDMLAGELRVATAFAELIGVLVDGRSRQAELEQRLRRIAVLSDPQ